MGTKFRRVLPILLGLVFVGSLAAYGFQLIQYHMGDEDYAQAAELAELPTLPAPADRPEPEPEIPSASQPEAPPAASVQEEPAVEAPVYVDPYADALRSMDFTALREVNEDVLGWILIPNTRLSYPLLQGEDNDYYLNRTWKKTRNSVGAIFMEWRSSPDLSDFNTIIYGHRMNNRSMFGILHNYDDLAYWEKHPCVYITDDSGTHTYEIFAAYEVAVTADTYRILFENETEQQAFLDFCMAQSVIDTGVVPNLWDRVLTLSTCTGDGHDTRWVVQAVERGEPPAPPAEPAPLPSEVPEEPQIPAVQAPDEDADVPVPAEGPTPQPDLPAENTESLLTESP